MLPQRALATLCRGVGLSEEGDKVALVRRYADHCRAAAADGDRVLALLDRAPSPSRGTISQSLVSTVGRPQSQGTRRRRADVASACQLDAHELPENLHALEAEQLAAVAAALGLPGETSDGKAALIASIESAVFRGRHVEAGLASPAGPGRHLGDAVAGKQRRRQDAPQALVDDASAAPRRPAAGRVGSGPKKAPPKGAPSDDSDIDFDDGSDSDEVILVHSTATRKRTRN